MAFLLFTSRLDVCDSPPETYMMCPLCDESLGCHPVDLHGSCMLGKVRTLTLPPEAYKWTFSKSLIVEQALCLGWVHKHHFYERLFIHVRLRQAGTLVSYPLHVRHS